MFSRSDVLQELPNSSRNATPDILARVFASTEPAKMNFSHSYESTESSTASIWIDCFFLKPYKAISMQQAPAQPPFQPRRPPTSASLSPVSPGRPRGGRGREGREPFVFCVLVVGEIEQVVLQGVDHGQKRRVLVSSRRNHHSVWKEEPSASVSQRGPRWGEAPREPPISRDHGAEESGRGAVRMRGGRSAAFGAKRLRGKGGVERGKMSYKDTCTYKYIYPGYIKLFMALGAMLHTPSIEINHMPAL